MHLEALTEKAAAFLKYLPLFNGFYLAGGTALALQLGHRVSVDFDLFSLQKIEKHLLPLVKKTLPADITISVNNAEELTIFADDIKITFLYYPFPLVEALTSINALDVLSVREIGITKAYTIGRRGSFKDYVDLYVIITGGFASLTDIITLSQKKFGAEFNTRLFLEQIIYLEDIEDTDILFLTKSISKKEIQQFFEEQVKTLAF